VTICVKTGMASEYKIATRVAAPYIEVLTGMWDADRLDAHLAKDCEAIISFGLCGGLNYSADVGSGFVCGLLETPDGVFDADTAWRTRLIRATGYWSCKWWSSGALNTANDARQRAALFHKTGAWVIDDETYAVALFAERRKIPFQALRVVSDSVDDNLPPAVTSALNANGTDNIEAVIESVCHDPFQIPALIKTALEYGKSLADLRSAAAHIGPHFCWQAE
jgi:adenosylhomocysteine nucleosidase